MAVSFGISCFYKFVASFLGKAIKGKNKFTKYVKEVLAISISVQIVIIPITAYFFKTVSFTFLVSNILTGFLITAIIILGLAIVLLSFPLYGVSYVLAKVYKGLICAFLKITEITAELPFSKVYIKLPYLYQIFLYYIFAFGTLYFLKTKKKFRYKKQVIIVFFIIMLIPNVLDVLPKENMKIYFIDVGQGDACLIVTPQNKKVLIDRRR